MKRKYRQIRTFMLAAGSVIALTMLGMAGAWGAASTGAGNRPVVAGLTAEPKSLDPAVDTALNDFQILVNIYDGLVTYANGSLKPVPALATSWTTSDDGTVYTFKLRQGVTFQDGTPFNAGAVKFNFDRMLVKGAPGSDTGPFPLAKQFFGDVQKVTVVDPHTVKFTLKKPSPSFLRNLAYPTGLIVSPTAVKKYGKDFGRHPVGTGAFAFKSWTPNQSVVLTANKDYWNGAPKTSTVVFRPLTDASARIAALRSGDVNLIVSVPATNYAQLKADPNVKVVANPSPNVWFLILNCKRPPFNDKRVRQAVNYAINKKVIVDQVLSGTASVATGPIAPAFGAVYDANLKGYPYNPQKAKKLLAEAGYKSNTQVTFYVASSGSGMLDPKQMAVVMQAQLRKVGINAKIQTFEWNTYLNLVNAGLEGKADMAEMSWTTNAPITLPRLTLRTAAFPDKGGFNSGYYTNPKVDAIIKKLSTETDTAKQKALYAKLQQIVVDDAPWVFVANGKFVVAMSKHLHGVRLNAPHVFYLQNAVLQ